MLCKNQFCISQFIEKIEHLYFEISNWDFSKRCRKSFYIYLHLLFSSYILQILFFKYASRQVWREHFQGVSVINILPDYNITRLWNIFSVDLFKWALYPLFFSSYSFKRFTFRVKSSNSIFFLLGLSSNVNWNNIKSISF